MPASKIIALRYNSAGPSKRKMTHVFAVGQLVKVLPTSFGRKIKDVEKSLHGDNFEVTRLLPEESSNFQYRIKNVSTGQERVVSENELRTAD